MNESIAILVDRVKHILADLDCTIYLYGSACVDDFKLGWSDIDILILTTKQLSDEVAHKLVPLRQFLSQEYPENSFFSYFEGAILNMHEFLSGNQKRVVYWGTSGQRITDKYQLDVFSIIQLKDAGILLSGRDIRSEIPNPTFDAIIAAIQYHCTTIKKYAGTTSNTLYSAGWMLDIARCLYTLKHGKVISKTQAGYWAIAENIVPDEKIMKQVLRIREAPSQYKNEQEVKDWLAQLEPAIQEFNTILERQLAAFH